MFDHSELKRLAEAAMRDQHDYAALNDYGMAMPPAVAIALIAEIERMRVDLGSKERDNNRLAGELAGAQIKSGELSKGGLVALEMLEDAEAERDQLRAEVESLRRQVDTLAEWYANSLNIISECSATLPGTTYMDPPDGGDVSIPEQMRRMAKDAERYRWLRDSSESIHQFYLSTPIWFTGVKFSKENVDSTIDAAMDQGEQP